MATELAVGREGAVKIADGVELELHGQVDLVLAQNDAASFAGQKIWIVDYKTGSTKELKTSDLHDNLVKGTTLAARSLRASHARTRRRRSEREHYFAGG